MHLRPALLLLAAILTAVPTIAQDQAAAVPVARMVADAHPSFEVATIKLHNPDSRHDGIDTSGERVMIWNQTVAKMMVFAYGINKHQIVDAPDWALNQSFDIQGRGDAPGQPSWDQIREMLQKLLKNRFSLQFHREQRELPVMHCKLPGEDRSSRRRRTRPESHRSIPTVMGCGASIPTPARGLPTSSSLSSSGSTGPRWTRPG